MQPRELPIWELHRPIVETLTKGNRLVLVAGTGSGKSTQAPQMVLDAGLAGDARIVVLEPRRVAARSVAARVASERGTALGREVGYQVRFDDAIGPDTRLAFVTEGVFLRWLQSDPELCGIGAVFLDEFHERNLLSDVALALVKRLQDTKRPDLKLIVMSATLEAKPVSAYLGGAPILETEGRPFPVAMRWGEYEDSRPAWEKAAEAVERIVVSGDPGDVLVFMPGMFEIQATINAIRSSNLPDRVVLLPLHGELPPQDQDRAFQPAPFRKVVVSTNVAETSVTIDGVRHVVDAGLARIARYDPERGLGTLAVEEISRASADQRAGRAGRTAPGVCWRLWTDSNHLNRPAKPTPEIQRADLAEVVLQLHAWGVEDAASFDWLDRPDPGAVAQSERLLSRLGAVGPDGGLTATGRRMLELPMHPRYSRMLVEAARRGCVPRAAMCAALTSGKDLLVRPGRDDAGLKLVREVFEGDARSDFQTLQRAYQFARNCGFDPGRCRSHGVRAEVARAVAATFDQFIELARRPRLAAEQRDDEASVDSDEVMARCLIAGFPDQVAARRDKGTLDCLVADGRAAVLARESVVQAPLLVAAGMREVELRGAPTTLLTLATAIEPEWLREIWPEHHSEAVESVYDRLHKRVATIRRIRFLGVLVSESHQRDPDPAGAAAALVRAFAAGAFELPNLTHEVRQYVARVNLAARALPELELKPFDGAVLHAALAEAFHGMTLAKDAQSVDLLPAVRGHGGPGTREWIESAAPTVINAPDGKKLKLTYPESPDAEQLAELAPATQVKLTDCWGIKEHPKIAEGRVPIVLRLTAPDGKRVDETTDFPAWRASVYPRLRSALKAKHSGFIWP
jgi:ATP-dependent helicase HrpB